MEPLVGVGEMYLEEKIVELEKTAEMAKQKVIKL